MLSINSHRFCSRIVGVTHMGTYGGKTVQGLLLHPILKLLSLLTVWSIISDLHKMKQRVGGAVILQMLNK